MQVIVQVEPTTARVLHGAAPATRDEDGELIRTVEELAITLEPLHPGTTDPVLRTFFMFQMPDSDSAARAAERLRQCRAVEAAYAKPRPALP
jgi:hypothetical protein